MQGAPSERVGGVDRIRWKTLKDDMKESVYSTTQHRETERSTIQDKPVYGSCLGPYTIYKSFVNGLLSLDKKETFTLNKTHD